MEARTARALGAVLVAALGAGMAAGVTAGVAGARETKAELKAALKDDQVAGDWIYDDIDAGFERARKEGKPLCVVFR